MSCNCNNANPTCDPCAFCTPPGVTGLTTCSPIDPCEETIPLDCVLYTGTPYDCAVLVNPNNTLTSILVQLFQYYVGPVDDCCLLEGDLEMRTTTTTTTTVKPTTTTSTTTTAAPVCSFYEITSTVTSSVIEFVRCGCELSERLTITSLPVTLCINNLFPITTIIGNVTNNNVGICSTSGPCPTTTTTTTIATPCTCNIYTVTNDIGKLPIFHTYTECDGTSRTSVTTSFANGSWSVCACSNILNNIPAGLIVSVAGAACSGPPTTTTTTLNCVNSGGTANQI